MPLDGSAPIFLGLVAHVKRQGGPCRLGHQIKVQPIRVGQAAERADAAVVLQRQLHDLADLPPLRDFILPIEPVHRLIERAQIASTYRSSPMRLS